ncbi:MAG: ferritin [Saprospiraceae bacterium]|nr:ferritin [Saprospiraceae bacterium]MDW8484767.1 ferritin [Saprospiraceae bacterium]
MLSESVQAKLNEQIQKEAFASNAYLAMASWAEGENLPNIAQYFYNSAEEERQHMLKIYKYVNANGGHARIENKLDKPKEKFKNVLDAFETVYDLECSVGRAINELASWCLQNGEHATYFFLQSFVLEQQEAERKVTELLSIIKRIGTEPQNLFYLDKTFKKINEQS